jgi:hypothetical protein
MSSPRPLLGKWIGGEPAYVTEAGAPVKHVKDCLHTTAIDDHFNGSRRITRDVSTHFAEYNRCVCDVVL